ncbi:hypothetical protein KGA66_12855 [Actinocrinis puniceicyclus]|uniref:DUF8175 domain-containing protein n=1 Tax=Actinocrinis puniceicyclus TaxID=977794 RepID=A0A8J8BCA5_9ACTN|nr:hypothetical protein [Actinocrinis puniceicyclus]MBS2963938.1 hypothetical protein [Actinocrinis puniceicyclus]
MRDLIDTHRVRRVLIAVGALMAATLVAVPLLMSHHPQHSAKAAPSQHPTTTPLPLPSGAVTLVHGAHMADGIETGYPHTTIGAISAAAQYLGAVASTLDPDYAASLMRVAGDPDDASLPASLAESTVKLRRDLQLPASGPLPPPTSFQTTPQMYQLRDATADSVMVLLLTSSTFINTRGGIAQTTGVFPVRMHWTGGDWRLADIGGTGQDFSVLAATPDTQEAAGRGWKALIATVGGAS